MDQCLPVLSRSVAPACRTRTRSWTGSAGADCARAAPPALRVSPRRAGRGHAPHRAPVPGPAERGRCAARRHRSLGPGRGELRPDAGRALQSAAGSPENRIRFTDPEGERRQEACGASAGIGFAGLRPARAATSSSVGDRDAHPCRGSVKALASSGHSIGGREPLATSTRQDGLVTACPSLPTSGGRGDDGRKVRSTMVPSRPPPGRGRFTQAHVQERASFRLQPAVPIMCCLAGSACSVCACVWAGRLSSLQRPPRSRALLSSRS